ncbi:MAG: quinone-interacting membrane-bound oxidoreductase complex subunit QmoC [Bryobacteraceae bacterium]|nr:quinone-interacting membrane-bound oxidoreductase complex subunit QmoC [Bryobacteraceae bacterium]
MEAATRTTIIQPDVAFLRDLEAAGGGDAKKCFQCATCSTVCALSPDNAPFPRKQMLEAQWGLKTPLLRDPALWLCHNCGDCTSRCPRGARPGDVIGALRNLAIRHFAFPQFLGRLYATPKAWPVVFLIPALLFLGIALLSPSGPAEAAPEFAHQFPILILEAVFFALSGFVVVAMAVGVWRFGKAMKAAGGGPILPGLIPVIADAVVGGRLRDCQDRRRWRSGHVLMLSGFVALAAVGTVIGVGTMFGVMETPLPLGSAIKIFANVAAVVILAGSVILLADRLSDPARRQASGWFDWFFLGSLAAIALTGVLSQVSRLAQAETLMYAVYFVHLVLVFALFLSAPYSKFAHFLYRTVALASVEPKRRLRI